jgi:hypothetical protein
MSGVNAARKQQYTPSYTQMSVQHQAPGRGVPQGKQLQKEAPVQYQTKSAGQGSNVDWIGVIGQIFSQVMQRDKGGQQQGQNRGSDTESKVSSWIDIARQAYGLYTAYTGSGTAQAAGAAIEAGTTAAGAAGAAGAVGGAGEAAGTASQAASNYAGYAAAAMSAANDISKLTSKNLTDEEKVLEAHRMVPRAVAAYYTAGFSNTIEAWARKQWPGFMKKLDKFAMKFSIEGILSRFWTSDKWKTEGNRLRKLQAQGVEIPEAYQGAMMQKRGRSVEEMENKSVPKDFVGFDAQGVWTNNKFNFSRDEADLRPLDIVGYAVFAEKFGNDWFQKFSDEQRQAIAQVVLDAKVVREHHGTIDIKWNDDVMKKIDVIAASSVQ